eukprot:scaffold144056_cov29-Tisochrysis_lutea.AAC.3
MARPILYFLSQDCAAMRAAWAAKRLHCAQSLLAWSERRARRVNAVYAAERRAGRAAEEQVPLGRRAAPPRRTPFAAKSAGRAGSEAHTTSRKSAPNPKYKSPPRSSRGPPRAIGGKFSPDRQQ